MSWAYGYMTLDEVSSELQIKRQSHPLWNVIHFSMEGGFLFIGGNIVILMFMSS